MPGWADSSSSGSVLAPSPQKNDSKACRIEQGAKDNRDKPRTNLRENWKVTTRGLTPVAHSTTAGAKKNLFQAIGYKLEPGKLVFFCK